MDAIADVGRFGRRSRAVTLDGDAHTGLRRLLTLGLPLAMLMMFAVSLDGGARAGDCAGTPMTVAGIELPTVA